MRGRKGVPTELKLLRGNPGRRPINKSEPKPETGIPPAPAHFSKHSQEEWDRVTPELDQLGLLTKIDRAALTVYCTAWGRHVEAETHLRAEGLMLIGRPKPTGELDGEGKLIYEEGKPYPNPWAGVSTRAIEMMQPMLSEFGLTPSSRGKLSVKPKAKKSAEEELFG